MAVVTLKRIERPVLAANLCFFPVNREYHVETRSLQTASRTKHLDNSNDTKTAGAACRSQCSTARCGMIGTFENRALAALRSGDAVACIWLSLGSVALAEIAAEQRPGAVVFDGQHGLWERQALHHAIAAVAPVSTPVVRVQVNNIAAIGEALDSGAQGVIVPLVETADEAAAAVAAAHYPPLGVRSGGGVRPLGDFAGYLASCARQMLVGVMIETARGLANAGEIVATPGLDMVFIGPGDLALALGPDAAAGLEPAMQYILALCQAANVPCGLFTTSPEAAAARIAQGFAFVVAEDDIHAARTGYARSLGIAGGKA
jgi:2-keto-3-deoxy-L-rhamnonate aldolase RhmA